MAWLNVFMNVLMPGEQEAVCKEYTFIIIGGHSKLSDHSAAAYSAVTLMAAVFHFIRGLASV